MIPINCQIERGGDGVECGAKSSDDVVEFVVGDRLPAAMISRGPSSYAYILPRMPPPFAGLKLAPYVANIDTALRGVLTNLGEKQSKDLLVLDPPTLIRRVRHCHLRIPSPLGDCLCRCGLGLIEVALEIWKVRPIHSMKLPRLKRTGMEGTIPACTDVAKRKRELQPRPKSGLWQRGGAFRRG
jgi:hypothetical protein